jgi:hypothetical protein
VSGTVPVHARRGGGLRPGNGSSSITADFVDEDAYRAYDAEAEHNRVRRELFDPICDDIVRVQFRA